LVKSANYDPNDLGYLSSANGVTYDVSGSYNQLTPTRSFITYTYSLDMKLVNLYKPYAFGRYDITGIGYWVLKNFWNITLSSQLSPTDFHDYFELRTTGRYLNYPLNAYVDLAGNTDSRKRLLLSYGGTYARSPEYNNTYSGLHFGFRYRFSNKFNLDIQADSHFESNQLGYAFQREPNGDPIVGFRDNREFISLFSSTYNFTPRLNLTLRARHYWNKVNYISFHDVDANGKLIPRQNNFGNSLDQNVNLFNLDAFLTWDFRLGSRLVLGYKNWLGDDELVGFASKNSYLYNLREIFDLRHGNEFTLRFIYFLDYNQFRKNP
ncbi:MAG: hypothetical protein JJE22_08330, partial [Bacteroidia bacterium]|nr:hypothetical protein [Bacteroidia bacterium]